MSTLIIPISYIRSFCLSFLFLAVLLTCINVFTSTPSIHRWFPIEYTSEFQFSSTKSTDPVLLLSSNDIHQIQFKCPSIRFRPRRKQQTNLLRKNISLNTSIELIESKNTPIPYDYEHWQSSPLIPRLVTKCEHKLMMQLLKRFDQLTKKYSLEYMMTDGTLLGSWRHHDLIPWDDDIDLLMSVKLKARLNLAIALESPLSSSHVIEFFRRWDAPKEFEYYKFYFSSSPRYTDYPWRYPFVDLIFYHENETHIWQENMQQATSVLKQKIFPLKRRPFGSLWLPAPKSPHDYLLGVNWTNYDRNCVDGHWSHKFERAKYNEHEEKVRSTIDCRDLYEFYPFVQRASPYPEERLSIYRTIKQILKIV